MADSLFLTTVRLWAKTLKRLGRKKTLAEILEDETDHLRNRNSNSKRFPRYPKLFPGIQLAKAAMTFEGWQRREQYFKYRYPVRFFISETVPRKISYYFYARKQKRDFKDSNKVIFEDLKPGFWHGEIDYFLHLAFEKLSKQNLLELQDHEAEFAIWWNYHRPMREEFVTKATPDVAHIGFNSHGHAVMADRNERFGRNEDRVMLKRYIDEVLYADD